MMQHQQPVSAELLSMSNVSGPLDIEIDVMAVNESLPGLLTGSGIALTNLSPLDVWTNLSHQLLSTNTSLGNVTAGEPVPWWLNWDHIPYKRSGYTQLGIVTLGFFLTVVMILVVVGNLLVCIAISTEKSLKTVQNWFIASLAVSDLLLGLVIMPFSLAYELMGSWIFGDIWCEVHHALDVLLCTASINNLCLISLDRYWAVTQAVEYLKKRTPSRALFMIAFVWIFSACVSLPPLVGWKGKEDPDQCSLSEDLGYVLYSALGSFFIPAIVMIFVYARIFIAARSRARRHVKKKKLLGAAGSTSGGGPAPSEVTGDPAKDKSTTTTTCTSMSNPSPPEQPIDDEDDEDPSGEKGSSPATTPKTPNSPGLPQAGTGLPKLGFRLPDVEDEPEDGAQLSPTRRLSEAGTCLSSPSPRLGPPQIVVEPMALTPHSSPIRSPTASSTCDIRTIGGGGICRQRSDESNKTVSFCTSVQTSSRNPKLPRLSLGSGSSQEGGLSSCRATSPILKQNGGTTAETRFAAVATTSGDEDSDYGPSGGGVESPLARQPVGNATAAETRAFLSPNTGGGSLSRYASSLSIADYDDSDICDEKDSDGTEAGSRTGRGLISSLSGGRRKKAGKVQYQLPASTGAVVRRPTPSDAERHKRKIAKQRERRATIILGLIMVSFISAWLPFFMIYLIQGICKACTISGTTFTFAFWLGYSNSAINPIIYTVFNRDFRKAFRKILFR